MPRIALLQLDPELGDLTGNLARALEAYRNLGGQNAIDDPVFPDAALVGHPVEGLAYRSEFRKAWMTLRQAAAEKFPLKPLPDGFVRLAGGEHPDFGESGPAALAAVAGAKALLVDAVRGYRINQSANYEAEVVAFARRHGVWWLEANLAGGQGAAIFAGGSLVVAPDGTIRARARPCEPDAILFELDADFRDGRALAGGGDHQPAEPENLYRALVVAIRDYVNSSGARGVVLGLSGGVDSALVAALAVAALGPGRVVGVTMPGIHTSRATYDDARLLAENLGIVCHEACIGSLTRAAHDLLEPIFAAMPSPPPDPENLTDQNLQARSRAMLLMGAANRLGLLLLNTSNKSEASMGYGTLYGDMAGGFAPIIDLYKSEIWPLCVHINRRAGRSLIPPSTIERPPTAELRPGQLDTDSLPPYESLDLLLRGLNEEARSVGEMLAAGFDPAMMAKTLRLWMGAEYKRRQTPPGPLVQASADWPERRLPMTHRFFPPELP